MHPSAFAHMQLCVDTYLTRNRHYDVLELGSKLATPKHKGHRELFAGFDVDYTGVDVQAGTNVDIVMTKPYRVPVRSNSIDLVVTGQVFEHIPFPWASFLEICRVLRPGGLIFMTVPSRGHRHGNPDCWRYFADSMTALAAWSRMELREAHTDVAPMKGSRIVYGDIDSKRAYWGDTVGVFQKPQHPSKLVRVAGAAVLWWANRVGGIDHVGRPGPRPARQAVTTTL